VYPLGLDVRAIYQCKQQRTIPGGTVDYTTETGGLLDVTDGLASKTVVVSADTPYFVLTGDAAPSGGQWQFDDYTNPKAGTSHPEIILRAFIQNIAAGGWYRWSSGQDFDTVRLQDDGAGKTKEESLSGTYWTAMGVTDTEVIAADDTPWDDDTTNKQVIYKYQSGNFFDVARLERIQEGADIRLLKLQSQALHIGYNGGATDYDPTGQIIQLNPISQNMPDTGVNWEILDKTGADVSASVILYDADTGGSPINVNGASVGYLRTADYAAGNYRFAFLQDNLPVTIKVTHDDYADQIDFVTLQAITGGAAGTAGIDSLVGYLDNEAELQACSEDGIPIDSLFAPVNGSLTLETNIVVYQGATDISTNYRIRSGSITAVDENGTALTKGTGATQYDYDAVTAGEFIVNRIPEGVQKVIVSLPIERISDSNLLVTKKFTISKALAGFTQLRCNLSNEFQVIPREVRTGTLQGGSPSGLAGYEVVGTVDIKGFKGVTELTPTLAQLSTDSIIGYEGLSIDAFDTAWPSPATLGETTAFYNRYTAGGNDVYFVLGDSGTLHIVTNTTSITSTNFDYTVAYQYAGVIDYRDISIRWLEQAPTQYLIDIDAPVRSFPGNAQPTDTLLVSARLIGPDGVPTAVLPTNWSFTYKVAGNTIVQGTESTKAGYTTTRPITRNHINAENQLYVTLLDDQANIVSINTITILDIQDSPTILQLYYSTDSVLFPQPPTQLDYNHADYGNGTSEKWGRTQNVHKDYLYSVSRSEYATEWGNVTQVRGEAGLQGDLIVSVECYKVDNHKPEASGGSESNTTDYTQFTPPTGWSLVPLAQGQYRLWRAVRSLTVDPNGISSWTDPNPASWAVSLLGNAGAVKEVHVYRTAASATPSWYQDYDSPANEFPQTSGSWENSIQEITSPNYIFRATGNYADGALRQTTLAPGKIRVELNAVKRTAYGGYWLFKEQNNTVIKIGAIGNIYIFNGEAYVKNNLTAHKWLKDNSQLHYWSKPDLIFQPITGPQGPKGDKGDTGATGATGPAGSSAGLLEVKVSPSPYYHTASQYNGSTQEQGDTFDGSFGGATNNQVSRYLTPVNPGEVWFVLLSFSTNRVDKGVSSWITTDTSSTTPASSRVWSHRRHRMNSFQTVGTFTHASIVTIPAGETHIIGAVENATDNDVVDLSLIGFRVS
jgi:hypothetical protein